MNTVLKHSFDRGIAKRNDFSDLQTLAYIFLKLLRRRSIMLNMSGFLQRMKLHKFQYQIKFRKQKLFFGFSVSD